MAKEPTICVKCKHFAPETIDELYPRCNKDPRLDPVTGHKVRWTCSTKNHGTCPDYEEADATSTPDPQADAAWGSHETDKEQDDG